MPYLAFLFACCYMILLSLLLYGSSKPPQFILDERRKMTSKKQAGIISYMYLHHLLRQHGLLERLMENKLK